MLRIFILTLALVGAMSCASAELGETCDTPGNADECVDGAICTNSNDGNVCRKSCTADSDCGTDERCNGIEGTNTKSCQPKDSKKK